MTRKKPGGVQIQFKPEVELIWLHTDARTYRKRMPWKRPETNQAVAEWIGEYLGRLEAGYAPEGFVEPPRPHCARVWRGKTLVAEWQRPFTIAELRLIDQRERA
jgi:hypothetical protein